MFFKYLNYQLYITVTDISISYIMFKKWGNDPKNIKINNVLEYIFFCSSPTIYSSQNLNNTISDSYKYAEKMVEMKHFVQQPTTQYNCNLSIHSYTENSIWNLKMQWKFILCTFKFTRFVGWTRSTSPSKMRYNSRSCTTDLANDLNFRTSLWIARSAKSLINNNNPKM